MSRERIVHWDPLHSEPLDAGEAVFSIGVFDGLHVGHRFLLEAAAAEARALGCALIVVTFDQDPDEFFLAADERPGKLLENGRRLELLARVTGQTVVSVPANRELFSMQPRAFLDALERIAVPRGVFVGCDFRFGSQASGTADDIAAWCALHGCAGHPCPLLERDGAPVTATRIRSLLRAGEVARARELLAGRAHAVSGRVVHGRGEGAGFGFATANLELPAESVLLPAEGVYAGYASVRGVSHAAAINVGAAKSFEQATAPIEAHLLDFTGDVYGATMELSFVEWLREPRVFSTHEQLVSTVTENIAWVREHLGGGAHAPHR